jgi:hypothetical protein
MGAQDARQSKSFMPSSPAGAGGRRPFLPRATKNQSIL